MVMEVTLIIAISELILKYGSKVAIELIKTWSLKDKNNLTIKDIENLKKMKPAAEYFK